MSLQTAILEGLNPSQREAVEAIDGPLLIVAGPGSGKTRVITHRVAYLVRVCGINPHRILAVTFTNKAAREMKDRLQRLVGTRADQLTVGTFHAFCAAVLRRDGKHVGLDSSFTIYDDEDQMNLVKQAMEQVQLDPKGLPTPGHPWRHLKGQVRSDGPPQPVHGPPELFRAAGGEGL